MIRNNNSDRIKRLYGEYAAYRENTNEEIENRVLYCEYAHPGDYVNRSTEPAG